MAVNILFAQCSISQSV